MKNKIKSDNNLLVGIIIGIGAVLLLSVFGFGSMMGVGYGNMMGGYGAGPMLLGWLTWILIIALIVAGIYWLIKSSNKK